MAVDKRDTVPIPHPRTLPFLGNILDIITEVPVAKLADLGKQFGEIYCLYIGGKRIVLVSNQTLTNELCDERRFKKTVSSTLYQLRSAAGDGLFTAYNEEENWGIAHRVLVPAFGPLAISGMFDRMKDIGSQLVLKWARMGSSHRIHANQDFTRLTLDTLALCAMDYRFNSFYMEDMHPFVKAMTHFLKYAETRAMRPSIMAPLYRREEAEWFKNIKYMRDLSYDLLRIRKEDRNPHAKDLMEAMINGKDPQTGKYMTEKSIVDNLITFLIAGHETTSAMLSFVFYLLIKNPDTLRKAQREVDDVVGKECVRAEHMNKLPYITAVLRETSRLHSTAPVFSVTTKGDQGEIIGDKYYINPGETVEIVLNNLHRDPAVYGDDAEEFKPERMLDERFNALPPNSWKPFGNGMRGCLGRGFAWQEMVLTVAMVLQYFDVSFDDPHYNLELAFTLTIKPKDLMLRATLREGWTALSIEQHLYGSMQSKASATKGPIPLTNGGTTQSPTGIPMTILYGSNSGTCETFAQTLAADAHGYGFKAIKVDTLDSAKQKLPMDQPVIIITASYEGEPCDNAAIFYNWLRNLEPDQKLPTNFAVFGCGHSDWKHTFHRVPITINDLLQKAGGHRICEAGFANAAKGDMVSEFQTWEDQVLWPALKEQFGAADSDNAATSNIPQSISVDVFSKRASHLRSDVSEAKVLTSKVLTAPGCAAEKRHVELQLPSDMTYRAGDYCAVLPLNPPETVHRVMIRFGLPWDSMLQISSQTGTTLPTEHPVSAQSFFSAYVELSQPATKRNAAMLIEAATDEQAKSSLQKLCEGDFQSEITDKRISLLDLLELYPSIQLPLSAFVASLIPMRVRQYSISSSPLANPDRLSLTYAVLDEPSLSGRGRHVGVASHYLSSLQPGDIVHVAIRPSHQAFHLPTDAEHIPVIMIAAGAGIAPFRGFMQERAAQVGAGRSLAPAHLYFGCRSPEQDNLYAEEIDFWEKMGALVVHRAFSRAPERSRGQKHIDETVLADRELLVGLWDRGAKVYVCGNRGLGESVKRACMEIAKEKARADGEDDGDEAIGRWFEEIRNERFSTDVFD